MKTFTEAFEVVKIKPVDGQPDPLEIANAQDYCQMIFESGDFIQYIQDIASACLAQNGGDPMSTCLSVASTCFIAGMRVGQEMEKTEMPVETK